MSSDIVTINPATGQTLHRYPTMTHAEVSAALDTAAAAQQRLGTPEFRRSRQGAARCCRRTPRPR